jgi:hypothetical protein
MHLCWRVAWRDMEDIDAKLVCGGGGGSSIGLPRFRFLRSQRRSRSSSSSAFSLLASSASSASQRFWILSSLRARAESSAILRASSASGHCFILSSLYRSEASAMHFIAQHTSIRVPKVDCVMEHIDGEMIARGRVLLSEESKIKIHSS